MPGKILVIDDEEDIAQVLVDRLEAWGFQTAVAHTGHDGLILVETFGPDLVLLDVRLPDQIGTEVLRRIRHGHPQLPVIIVSASYSPALEQEAREAGATDFVLKPYEPAELKAKINAALGKSR